MNLDLDKYGVSDDIAEDIALFLLPHYNSVDEWMLDSDYRYSSISGEWVNIDGGPWADPVDPIDAILGAMESLGFYDE